MRGEIGRREEKGERRDMEERGEGERERRDR